MTEDVRAARMLAAEKEAFRELEAVATEEHFAQIRAGQTRAAEASAWRLDLLRDLKRVNDHWSRPLLSPPQGTGRASANPTS